MKISYNWLKDYVNDLPSPERTAEILTATGLEVEGLEKFESIKGGLEGVVVGRVISCEKHPNADKLSVTRVDIGEGEPLPIVCGAPNVAEGQKVAVAPVGTTLYKGNESMTLKKVKIRGEVSQGMICAEDELGLGDDHEGIIVLDGDAETGTPLKEYFQIEDDYIFEIGLTPNRIDGASHIGAARDLAAFLNQDRKSNVNKPDVSNFKPDNSSRNFEVRVEDKEGCRRYSGVTLSGLSVKESPGWLKTRLKAIGLNPINNLVDITNYVLHETGQPLHAFDADKIKGEKVVIRTLPEGSVFKTLDEEERKLSSEDLMICDEKEGMCIAGVLGGIDSGVTGSTKSIFLESACFNPLYIRKTSKRHLINTDSSFRFERGSDPNNTLYALKRAALLMKEIAGGEISSEVVDVYPEPVKDFEIMLEYNYLFGLIGKQIEKERIRNILNSLDIRIIEETETLLSLAVPPYRVDVQRPADVVEEILRIYGYNNVETATTLVSNLSFIEKPDREKINNLAAEILSANGFAEIMSNSLTAADYYGEDDKSLVRIFNPLSTDLNAMRKNLLFGGLEAIEYNRNRQNPDLKLYEFGNIYSLDPAEKSEDPHIKYHEEFHLGIFLTGRQEAENWLSSDKMTDFYSLKSIVNLLLKKFGKDPYSFRINEVEDENFEYATAYILNNHEFLRAGAVSEKLRKKFDIPSDVFYAEFHWDLIIAGLRDHITRYQPVSKFPEVRRDLSMKLDRTIRFEDLRKAALNTEKKILKDLEIFDVYEGDKIEKGKKSYAVSFILQDENKTLTDKQIDKTMQKIANSLEKELGAQIRS